MNSEIHCADWTIPYPGDFDETTVPTVLRRLTDVEHEWEAFPWYLVGRLVDLLEKPESSFEYFNVTVYFRARAAMLALKGDVLDRKQLFAVMRVHQVQAGGIYRHHLLNYLRAFLNKHNFRELPECHGHRVDTVQDPEQVERNRGVIRRVVECAERDYVSTLNFLCVATEMEEEVARHSVGFWVDGGERPGGLDVGVFANRHERGYDVMPAPDEVKTLIRAGRAGGKVVVRNGEECGLTAGDSAAGRNRKPVNVEILQKAILASTPPSRRTWWQNARAAYERESGPLEADKWRAVAKMVVTCAIEEGKKPGKERHCDYVTPLMLRRLLGRLNRPGATRLQVESHYAGYLRRRVTEQERTASGT